MHLNYYSEVFDTANQAAPSPEEMLIACEEAAMDEVLGESDFAKKLQERRDQILDDVFAL